MESPDADEFVLKGALLFVIWVDEPHRATIDLDLLGRGAIDEERLRRVFTSLAEARREDDALDFDASSIALRRIREGERILGVTNRANEEFIRQVAHNVVGPEPPPALEGATGLIVDNDRRFAEHFRARLRDGGVACVRIPARAPDCYAFAERWVRSVKSECVRKMVFFGVGSLRRALAEYVAHYNGERSHQGIGNDIPVPAPEADHADGGGEVRPARQTRRAAPPVEPRSLNGRSSVRGSAARAGWDAVSPEIISKRPS